MMEPNPVFMLVHHLMLPFMISGFPDQHGKEFIIAFMDQARSMEIHITNYQTVTVDVEVTSPKWNNPHLNVSLQVSPGATEPVFVHRRLRMHGTSLNTKGILVRASDHVTVHGVSKASVTSIGGFLGIPLHGLGTEYYSMNKYPLKKREQEFLVAATEDSTTVNIKLSNNINSIQVDYQGQKYNPGDTIALNMNTYDTFQLQSTGELTGSHITSNKPISVYSGNVFGHVGNMISGDHLIEQLIPVNSWGTKFALMPMPDRVTGEYYKVIASVCDTNITYTCSSSNEIYTNVTLLENDGDFAEILTNISTYCYLESTKPVSVAQFVLGWEQHTMEPPTDPAMTIIPPFDFFAADYSITTPTDSQENDCKMFFLFVMKNNTIKGLTLDGAAILNPTLYNIPRSDYVAGYFVVPSGTHSVQHVSSGTVFGGIVYGAGNRQAYAFPAGLRLPNRKCFHNYQNRDNSALKNCEIKGPWFGYYMTIEGHSITSGILWRVKGTPSNVVCALLCSNDCRCMSFTYNKENQICKGHSQMYRSLTGIGHDSEPQAKYFV